MFHSIKTAMLLLAPLATTLGCSASQSQTPVQETSDVPATDPRTEALKASRWQLAAPLPHGTDPSIPPPKNQAPSEARCTDGGGHIFREGEVGYVACTEAAQAEAVKQHQDVRRAERAAQPTSDPTLPRGSDATFH